MGRGQHDPGEPHTPLVPQEILPGRGFTFWQWFDGVLDLTKRCLKSYWSDRWVLERPSRVFMAAPGPVAASSGSCPGTGTLSVCPFLQAHHRLHQQAVRLQAPEHRARRDLPAPLQ